MKLLILTTSFPYGTWHEAFFETEFQLLASSFEKINILPLKSGPINRSIPDNVDVWEPLTAAGWKFYFSQLLSCSTWVMLLRLLTDSFTVKGWHRWQRLKNCVAAACLRSALVKHGKFNDFLGQNELKVVYSYWGHFPAVAIPLAKDNGALTCVRYHRVDIYLEDRHNQGFIPYRTEIQRSTDMSVFISNNGLNYFNRTAATDASSERVVARLGSPDFGPPFLRHSGTTHSRDSLLVASVSTIGGVKRVHLIARLVKELSHIKPVEWHHFGAGDCALLNREICSDIPSQLQINLRGAMERAEIQKFYRSREINFFVNLSESEGVPVSIMEALNADIPVVASDVGGTSEVVVNGLSGMLVASCDCENSKELALAILAALEPGGMLDLSTPRKVWQERYDAIANAQKMINYLRILANDDRVQAS